jgi:hypothetical protein
MPAVAVADGKNLDGCSHNGEKTANQYGIVILSTVSELTESCKGRTEHTQPRARLPYLAHNLERVVSIVRDVRTQVRVRRTPPRDSSGGSGLGGIIVDMEIFGDIGIINSFDVGNYEDQRPRIVTGYGVRDRGRYELMKQPLEEKASYEVMFTCGALLNELQDGGRRAGPVIAEPVFDKCLCHTRGLNRSAVRADVSGTSYLPR